MAWPGKGEAGITGHWRTQRPVLDPSQCVAAKTGEACCQVCWLLCPEAAITRVIPMQIDLTYCKGCGICAEVCKAITMVDENAAEEE